jgi:RNA polymerase sigma-70 factor, ECF subfamily
VIKAALSGHDRFVAPTLAQSLLLQDEDACEAILQDTDDEGGASATVRDARLRGMVEAHFDAVYNALRRLGAPPGDLEDCAQQVFVIASGKLAAIKPGRERAFLMGTAVNVASHARRALRRRREVPEEEAGVEPADSNLRPDELVEQKHLRLKLDAALAAMPDDLRTVFVLFELSELSTQEIAAELALPMGTVASRLRRAREMFTRLSARFMGGNHA